MHANTQINNDENEDAAESTDSVVSLTLPVVVVVVRTHTSATHSNGSRHSPSMHSQNSSAGKQSTVDDDGVAPLALVVVAVDVASLPHEKPGNVLQRVEQ